MNVQFDKEEIQAKYFRTGAYTHLQIKYNPETTKGEWIFTFADMGMCHVIESSFSIKYHETNTIYVDNIPHNTSESAFNAVFGNHYKRFMNELYEEI